ncbi:MAG: arginase family protein [Erysipelotrichales bacterium]
MPNIQINMCDLGCGANRIGILHGYTMIKALKPELAAKINYLPYALEAENMKLENKKFYNTILSASLKVYEENLKVLNEKKVPILLGGDHSLALGSVRASMKANEQEDIGLVWIDAHADINTFETSDTGHIHGMPVAGLVGLNDEKYNTLGFDKKIKFENLVYFATRSVDHGEAVKVAKYDILELSDAKIYATSFEERLEEMINHLKGKVNKVHISLDLDSINPETIKGVSTPVFGGLSIDQPIKIFKRLKEEFEVVSIDIVEYNPLTDVDEMTIKYVEDLITDIEELFN